MKINRDKIIRNQCVLQNIIMCFFFTKIFLMKEDMDALIAISEMCTVVFLIIKLNVTVVTKLSHSLTSILSNKLLIKQNVTKLQIIFNFCNQR